MFGPVLAGHQYSFGSFVEPEVDMFTVEKAVVTRHYGGAVVTRHCVSSMLLLGTVEERLLLGTVEERLLLGTVCPPCCY